MGNWCLLLCYCNAGERSVRAWWGCGCWRGYPGTGWAALAGAHGNAHFSKGEEKVGQLGHTWSMLYLYVWMIPSPRYACVRAAQGLSVLISPL